MYTADRFMPTRGQIKNAMLVDVPIGTPDTSVHYDPVSAAIGVGGALLQGRSARKAAQTQADAQRESAEMAYEQSMPWNLTAAGANISVDEDGKTMTTELSPELQSIYEGMFSRAGQWTPMVEDLMADPFTAQQRLYEQQRQLFAPQQEQERLALENRLLSQGMLGSTGGALRTQALREAQGTQDLQRQIAAMTQAQGLLDTYLGRQQSDIGTATALLDIPLQYGGLSRGIGGTLGQTASVVGSLRNQAAQTLGAAQAAYGSSLGNALSGLGGMMGGGGGGGFSNLISGATGIGSQYNPFQSGFFGYNPGTAMQYGTSPFSQQTAMLNSQW